MPAAIAHAAEPAKAAKAKASKSKSAKKAAKPVKKADAPYLVARLAEWVAASDDNQGLPYAIIDKGTAVTFVYDAKGKLIGGDASLVGLTPGDQSTPGIGDRELSDMPPEVRVTPAGRFVGGYGPSGSKGQVLWVDFATAISIHAVPTAKPQEKRVERLKSPTSSDNRITFGCINVTPKFYSSVVKPTFKGTRGVFYILPEHHALGEIFPQFGHQLQQVSAPSVEVTAAPATPG